jgi:hypothetical protein
MRCIHCHDGEWQLAAQHLPNVKIGRGLSALLENLRNDPMNEKITEIKNCLTFQILYQLLCDPIETNYRANYFDAVGVLRDPLSFGITDWRRIVNMLRREQWGIGPYAAACPTLLLRLGQVGWVLFDKE